MKEIKGLILSAWSALDPLYFSCTRLHDLKNKQANSKNILRVRLTKYKGHDIVLSDGTKISKNDTLIKIHLHNVHLLREMLQIKSEVKKGKHIYNRVKQSLPDLATYLSTHIKVNEIKGVLGITSLSKGSKRLGFEVVDIANPIYRWYKFISHIPLHLLCISKPTFPKSFNMPSYLFMSKDKLLVNHLSRENK